MKRYNAILSVTLLLSLVCVAIAQDPRDAEEEIRLTRAMDELNKRDTINIYGDMITLEKVASDEEEGRSKSEDPLIGQIERFLNTRRIRFHLPNDGSSADMFGRALGRKDVGVELRGLITGASEGENYFFGMRSWR